MDIFFNFHLFIGVNFMCLPQYMAKDVSTLKTLNII